MNLIDRIFGRKNPTHTWIADPTVPLQVDLDSCRFCEVALGTSIEPLRHLGPSANSQGRGRGNADTLVYDQQGFLLFLDAAQCLEAVDINLLAEEDMAAFTGRWLFQGQSVTIEAASTPAQIQSLLGTPDEKEDADNKALLYRRANGVISFEWGQSGRLENVMLDIFLPNNKVYRK